MEARTTGLRETLDRLRAVNARLRDLGPVLEVIAADTQAVADDSFSLSQTPAGAPWAPLAASTIRGRRRGSGVPLVDTGRLRASVTATPTATGIRFGTNAAYGGFHQHGTRRIPSRAFLPVDGSPGSYSLTTGGRGGVHWARARAAVKRYILTGDVS